MRGTNDGRRVRSRPGFDTHTHLAETKWKTEAARLAANKEAKGKAEEDAARLAAKGTAKGKATEEASWLADEAEAKRKAGAKEQAREN